MSASASVLDALVRLGMTQPVVPPVPADDAHFVASKGRLRVAQRVLKQRLELMLSGQRRLRCEHIEPVWRRAIWFHAEAPQIGDALMDLAPRSLLLEHDIALTLIAPAPTAALFRGDRGFVSSGDDSTAIDGADFDFAIVDSDSRKALALKRRHVASLPWVSIRGAYLGYDFQRGLLATRRLAAWLGARLTAEAEALHATQKLLLDAEESPTARPTDGADRGDARPTIAIALGGVRAERSYRRWHEVARRITAVVPCRFVLLGSANAAADRDAFVAAATTAEAPLRLLDRVAATSLHEAARFFAECDLVLCADGGLMHLALTTPTPVVALFDASVDPAWRLPPTRHAVALRAEVRNVNAIDPERVASAAVEALAALRSERAFSAKAGSTAGR